MKQLKMNERMQLIGKMSKDKCYVAYEFLTEISSLFLLKKKERKREDFMMRVKNFSIKINLLN